jgi:hypothetical protein
MLLYKKMLITHQLSMKPIVKISFANQIIQGLGRAKDNTIVMASCPLLCCTRLSVKTLYYCRFIHYSRCKMGTKDLHANYQTNQNNLSDLWVGRGYCWSGYLPIDVAVFSEFSGS